MTESRELFPASKDETGGESKILYSRYIPMQSPPVNEDETEPTHDRNDLARCHCCGFLWLVLEMEKGLCPKCNPRPAVECPNFAPGSLETGESANPRMVPVSGRGRGKMGLPYNPYYDCIEYNID
jgi:hypothetical protein